MLVVINDVLDINTTEEIFKETFPYIRIENDEFSKFIRECKGKVAVVTGASSGIGARIAEDLVKAGVSVVGLARRLDRLKDLSSSLEGAKGKFYARQCDLRREEDILGAFKWVNTELGGVDILVNNAGVINYSPIIDDDVDSFRNILEVNVLATTMCLREAVASMKSRDVHGYIVNINSVVGHRLPRVPLPLSLYPSSKFAVTALTETVRKELASEANNKIKISSISPGYVKTEIIETLDYGDSKTFWDTIPYLETKDVSDAVLYILGTPHNVQVTELTISAVGDIF